LLNGLIGHTGFVGGNLARQFAFDACFNSKNFREMAGREFDLLVCAGVSAVKWRANKEPEADRRGIEVLEQTLAQTRAKRFVLISTIDVYPETRGHDEDYDCGSKPNHPYGAHRLAFERFVADHFDGALIVRLPGLFGEGLKKNVVYDLINDNCLEMINPRTTVQYYDLSDLWADIETALRHDLRLVNLFNEPIASQTILDRFFPGKPVGGKPAPEAHYDLRSKHAALFGGRNGYIRNAAETLAAMGRFIETELAKREAGS